MSPYSRIEAEARALGLMVMGTVAGREDEDFSTLVLLGAAPGFWDALQAAPEGRDGAPDPVDRYSTRVIGALAADSGARAIFPFGGPPWQPFIAWAERSGRAWPSPVGMLVHDRAGLMISYRGALAFDQALEAPRADSTRPCDSCADRPCANACPVGALGEAKAYDIAACHAYLDSKAGSDCMTQGCAVRRACPVSQRFGRDPAQSAHHMKAFHPA